MGQDDRDVIVNKYWEPAECLRKGKVGRIQYTRRFSGLGSVPLGGLTPKKLRKAILFVTIILVFSKMGNILTIRIIGEQLTIPMLEQDG